MNKPFSIIKSEFSRSLISLIENCELPPSVISDVLRIVSAQVDRLAYEQYKRDLEAYKENKDGD